MTFFDILSAATLLTRIPLPIDHARAGARGARAAWAYPVVGACLGAWTGLIAALLTVVGVDVGVSAGAALAINLAITGALHEDGLADAADGLGGGASRERALEIMSDSRVGAYGASALTLSLLLRWSAITALLEAAAAGGQVVAAVAALAAAGAVSRTAMVAGLALLPAAKRDGLAAGAGRAPLWTLAVAVLCVGLIVLGIAVWPGLDRPAVGAYAAGAVVAALLAALFLSYARRRLGGQTGDVLGASQQLAEIGFLAAVSAAR